MLSWHRVRGMGVTEVLLGLAVAAFIPVQAHADESQAVKPPATEVADSPISAVVELFTSQGCSSCPPADALLRAYAERPDVLALTMPVDYWDYLGWADTFASAKNTERQKAYAKARGDGAVYTPQVVVNGVTHSNGASRQSIDRAIDANKGKFLAAKVPLRFHRDEGTFIVETGGAPAGSEPKEATIWLAVVQRFGEVPIRRGENSGRSLAYYNIVRELTPIGTWSGKPVTIKIARQAVMRPNTITSAVLIQQGTAGPIIGAAWLGM